MTKMELFVFVRMDYKESNPIHLASVSLLYYSHLAENNEEGKFESLASALVGDK